MRIFTLFSLLFFLLVTPGFTKDYTQKREVKVFIDRMVKKYGFKRSYLNRLFRDVDFQREALAIYVPSYREKVKPARSAKKQGSWDRYEEIFLKESKVQKGVQYMHQHRKTLQKAYREFGVEPEFIAAIIGIESHYGVNTGKYPTFDTLTTLAFEPHRRQKFYRSELLEFLLMTRREKVNPKGVKGSYAGAIGLGQFIPSNYKTFVVDFNRDGKKRMHQHEDAIGSIAYYLKRHGWKKGKPVAVRVSYPGKRYNGKKTGFKHRYHRKSLKEIYPRSKFSYKGKVHLVKLQRFKFDELWYGTKNFYVITRYNHSDYYAMAVYQLAQRLREGYRQKYGRSL
ncbi:MAG: lytic murein transglycosylase B [Sulfurovum sp.]|nr:lytic murein transglycosylase B [Sulfurovum sp.]